MDVGSTDLCTAHQRGIFPSARAGAVHMQRVVLVATEGSKNVTIQREAHRSDSAGDTGGQLADELSRRGADDHQLCDTFCARTGVTHSSEFARGTNCKGRHLLLLGVVVRRSGIRRGWRKQHPLGTAARAVQQYRQLAVRREQIALAEKQGTGEIGTGRTRADDRAQLHADRGTLRKGNILVGLKGNAFHHIGGCIFFLKHVFFSTIALRDLVIRKIGTLDDLPLGQDAVKATRGQQVLVLDGECHLGNSTRTVGGEGLVWCEVLCGWVAEQFQGTEAVAHRQQLVVLGLVQGERVSGVAERREHTNRVEAKGALADIPLQSCHGEHFETILARHHRSSGEVPHEELVVLSMGGDKLTVVGDVHGADAFLVLARKRHQQGEVVERIVQVHTAIQGGGQQLGAIRSEQHGSDRVLGIAAGVHDAQQTLVVGNHHHLATHGARGASVAEHLATQPHRDDVSVGRVRGAVGDVRQLDESRHGLCVQVPDAQRLVVTCCGALLTQRMGTQGVQLVTEVAKHQRCLVDFHASGQLQFADFVTCSGVKDLAVELVDAQRLDTADAAQRKQAVVAEVQVPLSDGLELLVKHLQEAVDAAHHHFVGRRLIGGAIFELHHVHGGDGTFHHGSESGGFVFAFADHSDGAIGHAHEELVARGFSTVRTGLQGQCTNAIDVGLLDVRTVSASLSVESVARGVECEEFEVIYTSL
mmetsp:Transcript_34065/g.58527  ORF Transcript_34065/g.58527 Transcript_34065/m.58527 type:complete len:702 (-) Transcript_34065:2210-4315(-)